MHLYNPLLLSLLTLTFTLTTASPAPDLSEREPLSPSHLGAIPLHQERAFTPALHSTHEREAPLPPPHDRDAPASPISSPATPTRILAVRQETDHPGRKTIWSKFGFNVVVENKKKVAAASNLPKVGPIQCLGPYGRTFCMKWCYCSKDAEAPGLVLCDKKVASFRKGDSAIKAIHSLSLRGFCGPVCSCWVNGDTKFQPLPDAEWNDLRRKLNSLHPDKDEYEEA